jgi:hypothetical protein
MPQHLFSLGEILAMLEVVGIGAGARARFKSQADQVAAKRPALGESTFEVSSSFGHHNKRGYVNVRMGTTEEQMTPAKAKEIAGMLHDGAEAAVGDEVFMKLLDFLEVSDTPEHRGAILLKLRELRQGSRGVVYPQ